MTSKGLQGEPYALNVAKRQLDIAPSNDRNLSLEAYTESYICIDEISDFGELCLTYVH